MPRPPLPGPDSSNRDLYSTLVRKQEPAAPLESNLAELADTFAARVPDPELSADLALQIVLNEIAEQACLTTGATGAAIALERNSELVCRASSGSTAPALGAPLNTKQGLSGECVRKRQVQVCDDIENDPRADPTASQLLGARSVIVLPLVRGAEVVGVLEAFSTRAAAFGEQDQRTLEALGRRVIRNIELAESWSPAPPGRAASDDFQNRLDLSRGATDQSGAADGLIPDLDEAGQRGGIRVTTYVLGVLVLLIAMGLWARIFERLGWLGTGVGSRTAAAANGTPGAPTQGDAAKSNAANQTTSLPPAAAPAILPTDDKQAAAQSAPAGKSGGVKALPPGSLAVYDRGKEVFRMVPGGQAASATPEASSSVRQAVSIEPEATSKSPGNLLRRVEPDYPPEARQQKIQGAVVLDVRVGGDGSVQQVKLISGHPLLAAAAIAAVNQWQFKPHLVNGLATDIETTVTLDFRLPE